MSLYKFIEGRTDGVGVPEKIILRCDCIDECELEISRFKGSYTITNGNKSVKEPDEYFFTFRGNVRNNTLNMFEALKIKLKKIWCIIRGKDYLYYDIEVDEYAMKEFTESLQKFVNSK